MPSVFSLGGVSSPATIAPQTELRWSHQRKQARLIDPRLELGTSLQAQQVPPQQQPPGIAFPKPGSLEFNMFVAEIAIIVGSMVVSIGSSIAASMNADLTGWKVAGLMLDAVGFGMSIVMLATFDMSMFPPIFSMLIWISLGLSGLSLIWGAVRLGLYIHRRNKLKEQLERQKRHQIPAPTAPKPVAVVPWGVVDREGNAAGGLAFFGQF